MRKVSAASGTALFFAAAPGVVAGVVPWALTDWRLAGDLPVWLRVVGGAVTFVAAVLLIHSFARFVIEGSGTPAPPAPTERLVVGGLYRYVRNPMYLAVLAAVLGQALLLGQAVLVPYAVVLLAAVVSFVRWYEEPTLRQRFGPAYDSYRASVPGWIPRLSSQTTRSDTGAAEANCLHLSHEPNGGDAPVSLRLGPGPRYADPAYRPTRPSSSAGHARVGTVSALVPLRATQVYRREDGEWRVAHRHGDTVTG